MIKKRAAEDKKNIFSGQSTIEMAILLMVVVFAMVAMQTYLKRGIQGKLRSDIDQVGSQYDFGATTSESTTAHVSNVTTTTTSAPGTVVVPGTGGATTDRLLSATVSETHYDNMTRVGSETVANP